MQSGAEVPAVRPFPGRESLRPLLQPRGIAVVGASGDPRKFSGRLVSALQRSGYGGGLYPVNPRYGELGGLRCYPDVAAVPDPCDLVLVAVPAPAVVPAVEAAAARGAGAAVVFSAGFDEIGGEGARRAADLRRLAGRIRIYGPNCPGLWQIADGLVYTFSEQFDPAQLRAGPIGVVTQGGALGRAILDGMQAGLGVSYWFSTGNEADLDIADFVAWLADEPRTSVVAVLAEGFRDGRRFLAAAERCRAAGKPVVVLPLGRSAAGRRAAAGHTAAPGGDPQLAAALLQGAGALCVSDLDELCDLAGWLAIHGRAGPISGGLGVCTFSGGAGVLLCDLAAEAGLPVPALGEGTAAALRALLPPIAAVGNPTDLTTAVLEDPALAVAALERMLADPALGLVLFPLPHRLDRYDADLARRFGAAAAAGGKPFGVVAHSPVFEREEAAGILRECGVPVFGSARRAVLTAARWLGTAGGAAEAPEAMACAGLCDPAFGAAVRCGPPGGTGSVAALAPLSPRAAEAVLSRAPWLPGWRARGGDPAALARLLVRLGDRAAAGLPGEAGSSGKGGGSRGA